jgi:hypothetical protein
MTQADDVPTNTSATTLTAGLILARAAHFGSPAGSTGRFLLRS